MSFSGQSPFVLWFHQCITTVKQTFHEIPVGREIQQKQNPGNLIPGVWRLLEVWTVEAMASSREIRDDHQLCSALISSSTSASLYG